MIAIHVLASNCLLHNPEAFTDQSVKNVATDSLRTNPTKQAVNQYLIDAILQKQGNVQRSDNLWERSLYNTTSDTPPRQWDLTRRHRLDEDDESTPGTSASSNTSRRRISSLRLCETSTTNRQQPSSQTPQTGQQKSVTIPVFGR